MGEKKNKPEIRFKGFSEPWERRELGEKADFLKGNGYSKKDLVGNGTPIILYGRLYTKYQTVISEVDTFANANNNSTYSTGNEVIVPSSGETAEDIARASAVVKSGILLGSDLNIVYPSNDIISIFLALSLSNSIKQRELSKRAQGKTVVHLHNTDLKEVSIAYPGKKEQTKIAVYFNHLDKLITLRQRKHDKLVKVKKSMLEKMFPRDGADVPEIRFAEFSEPWERRELGEVSSLITKGTTPLDKSGKGSINFIKIENINHFSGEITTTSKITKEEHEGYLIRSQLKEDDILFSIAGTLGRVTTLKKEILPANTNQALAIIRLKNGCLNYITTYLKGKAVTAYIKKNPTIGAQPNLSLEQVGNLEILFPIKKEQTKISNYFNHLDKLITLQLQGLDKLKKIKKSCLEKMFV